MTKRTLKHFTNVYYLKKMLSNGMRFSDGSTWDDKNDVYALELYHDKTGNTAQILCFNDYDDTFYHWIYYGHKSKNIRGKSGHLAKIKCYVGYDKEAIMQHVKQQDGIVDIRSITYSKIDELQTLDFSSPESILFVKRKGFDVDHEIRAVYVGQEKPYFLQGTNQFIVKISISGLLTSEEFITIKEDLIKSFPELRGKIVYNKIANSNNWQNAIEQEYSK